MRSARAFYARFHEAAAALPLARAWAPLAKFCYERRALRLFTVGQLAEDTASAGAAAVLPSMIDAKELCHGFAVGFNGANGPRSAN